MFARKPKTNNMESMTLDFPLPLGPTIDVKLCERKRKVKYQEKIISQPVRVIGNG